MLVEELSFCGCATAKSLFIHLFFFLSIRGDLMLFIDFLDCLFVYQLVSGMYLSHCRKSKYKLSYLFLSQAVNQWIKERV